MIDFNKMKTLTIFEIIRSPWLSYLCRVIRDSEQKFYLFIQLIMHSMRYLTYFFESDMALNYPKLSV